MKPRIIQFIAILSLTGFTSSCTRITPAGFWTTYHKHMILTKNSDQGPWGGRREIYWQCATKNSFTARELIEFAKKNDWKLVDTITISANTVTLKRISALRNEDYSLELLKQEIIPNIDSGSYKVYVFKTTWLAVEPGNNRETFENGFALINSSGTELRINHIWGE